MPREYTMEEKAVALAVYVEKGVAEAWRQTGIPKPTIASWARRGKVHTNAPVKTQAATEAIRAKHELLREQIRLQLLEKASDLLDRMDAEHIEFKGKDADEVVYPIAPASAVQNYATSVGILIDKYRLEAGEATGRTEHRTWTDDLDDHEKAALRDAIDAELERRAAPSSSESAGSEVR